MIDPKELRWGNYILLRSKDCKRPWTGEPMPDGDDFLLQVSKNFDWQLHGDKFTPIPLTLAVLEAVNGEYESAGKVAVVQLANGLAISKIGERYSISNRNAEPPCAAFTNKQVRYLHQLQNLYYALTGSELDIDGDKLAEAITQ